MCICVSGCPCKRWWNYKVQKSELNIFPSHNSCATSEHFSILVCSEEEARKKIYSVSTKHYFAFGALVSEELSYKIKSESFLLCPWIDTSFPCMFPFCVYPQCVFLDVMQPCQGFVGFFLILIWTLRTKIMEVRLRV